MKSEEKFNVRLTGKLARLGIKSDRDLLLHFPFRYEDFSHVAKIAELVDGEATTVRAVVKDVEATPRFGRHIGLTGAVVSDDTGSLRVTWFNQPWVAKQIAKGDEIFLSGTVERTAMANPLFEKVTDERIHAARILPIYPSTAQLAQKTIRDLVHGAVANVGEFHEFLPGEALRDFRMCNIQAAIKTLHFPENFDGLTAARRRVAFEEILVVQLAVAQHKAEIRKQHAVAIPFNQKLVKNFLASLPFTLTLGQKKALWDVLRDMEKTTPMNRLVEGDVGSGKTLVALTAALEALEQKHEVALLCPTEILAQQHYASALERFQRVPARKLHLAHGKIGKAEWHGRAAQSRAGRNCTRRRAPRGGHARHATEKCKVRQPRARHCGRAAPLRRAAARNARGWREKPPAPSIHDRNANPPHAQARHVRRP